MAVTRADKETELADLESRIQQRFATRVAIRPGRKGRGRVEFEYYSREDLERLLEAWNVI